MRDRSGPSCSRPAARPYDLDFTNIFLGGNLQNIYILIEQWSGAGGLPGHAYFDNIQLQAMP